MSNVVTSITVRMYNTGSVGDCLLFLFKKEKVVSFKMLIDCGGWNADTDTITACVEDIKATTEGKIDLLIVTHQHLDHVSGFNQARSVFDEIEVKEVWMSWIEDASDEIGRILKEKFGKKLKELKKVSELAIKQLDKQSTLSSKVIGLSDRINARKTTMADMLQLIELEEGLQSFKGLGAGKRTNDEAMDYVRSKGKISYRLPGEVLTPAGAEGIKFFILGPPRDADMRFFKIDMNEEEMYHFALNASKNGNGSLNGNGIATSGITLVESTSPFDPHYQINGNELREFNKLYNSTDYEWRQIETDWLESESAIALRVNRLTNNTSLAMALQFSGSEKVMLLPADAQSGNWMGWHKPDVMKQLKKNGGKDTDELLHNTVFYKVGHHGSHNGTASVSGLDKMVDKKLVAMMPLVQDKVPEGWGGAANFPARALYDVLIEKAKGRIIRTDEGVITEPKAKEKRNQLSTADKSEFEKSFRQGSCFMEYTIKG